MSAATSLLRRHRGLKWNLESAGITECGASREQNGDYILREEVAGIFAVADGLGGYEGGTEASELLCAVFAGELMETETGREFGIRDARSAFARALETSLDGMRELAAACPSMSSMGSTLVAAWFVNDQLYYTHAGDSRLYLLRGNRLSRLTEDDSLVENMCREGLVSENGRRTNTWRHYLTRYIGPRAKDTRLRTDQLEIFPGDRLILLTDGVTESLDDEAIRRAANIARSPDELCRWLTIASKNSGARDDISCVVVDFNVS